MNKTIIVLGSSRLHGNTWKLCKKLSDLTNVDIINLKEYDIHEYDYDNKYDDDDFPPLLEKIAKYDTIIFATPIYWYSMSARLKMFIDRLSDLITTKKDLGRQIKGKNMALLSTNYDGTLDFDFALPFRMTAKYLHLEFTGHLHLSGLELESDNLSDESKNKIEKFIKSNNLEKDLTKSA